MQSSRRCRNAAARGVIGVDRFIFRAIFVIIDFDAGVATRFQNVGRQRRVARTLEHRGDIAATRARSKSCDPCFAITSDEFERVVGFDTRVIYELQACLRREALRLSQQNAPAVALCARLEQQSFGRTSACSVAHENPRAKHTRAIDNECIT